ncbi:MAG: putative metalloprotease CJM1_0395 family protein [Sulfurospirillaceae bacterium]|nr:putative metalloprotease CJM1_0395 family protein [Sulfurospirillaceae bacterium]
MQIGSFLNASYIRIDTPSTNKLGENTSPKNEPTSSQKEALSTSEKALITQLQASDSAVKAHERAHISAGAGVILSGATFVYQEGPDKKLYAIGGEVSIDTAEENTPRETIAKMQIVRTAALAPRDPSSTDYQVAATASMLQMQARLEESRQKQADLLANASEKYANNTDTPSLFSNYA